MSFLKAEWRKLVLVNYVIEPAVLLKYLPAKTELDTWNGRCYVSVVGFMFLHTKLLGFSIPFHRHFEEVNLRFYVKYKDGSAWKRGVVFIKEIVPKPALTFVANTVYKEHYQTLRMSHQWFETHERRFVKYAWEVNKQTNFIAVNASPNPEKIAVGSEAEFITEHYWGYTKTSEKSTLEYEVRHPRWEVYQVTDFEVNVDFKANYGEDFAFLSDQKPFSVMLAEGSEVSVENKRTLP